MDLKKLIIKIIIVVVISGIYIIPVSSNFYSGINIIEKSNYNVFSNIRIVFMLMAIGLLIFDNRKKISTYMFLLVIMIIFILKYFFYNELDFGLFYIVAAIIIFDSLIYYEINYDFIKKMLNISFYTYILQIMIFSTNYYFMYGFPRIVASFNDSNYTAYFGLCLIYFFYVNKQKIKMNILVVLMMFTFSRLYIMAVLLFFMLRTLHLNKSKIRVQYSMIFYILIQIVVLSIGVYFINVYELIKPEYVFLKGFQRLKSMLDESNYIRFMANLLALKSISIKSFFLGLPQNTFEGLYMFSNKSIFPHNLLWSMHIQYGLFITMILISKYIENFKKIGKDHMTYYFLIIMYHSFLGLSSFYGFDLILQLLIMKTLLSNKERETCQIKL